MLEGQRVDSAMVSEILERENSIVLTANSGGELVACCELTHRAANDEVYLGMFAVKPMLQAGGVGRQMLHEAERVAISRWSASQMAITVIELRRELIEWYERRGYVRTGVTGEFPYGDERFGVPLRSDLEFVELIKSIEVVD